MFPILCAFIGGIAGIAINWLADFFTAHYALTRKFYAQWRAPLVVIISAILFAVLGWRFDASIQLALTMIYTFVFLLVFVTDIEHRLIFNVVILPAIGFAIIASPFSKIGWKLAITGGVAAFIVVYLIYISAILFGRWRRLSVQGGVFGQGDVKLATFMGLVVGLGLVFQAIVYTILLGGIGALLFLAVQYSRTQRLALTAAIPYGPFFCIAGWALMTFAI